MPDRRLLLALGAASLFGAGFGLGWLVRGERTGDSRIASSSASAVVGDAGPEAGTTLASARADGGTIAEGTLTRPTGERGDAPAGAAGDVAVVGGGGEGARGAAGAAGTEAEGGGAAAGRADGGVRGHLDATAIREVVREQREQLGFCFAWQLHQNPELNGRITMEFVIGPDGAVTEARVAEDALGDETVLRCFVGVTRRMQFPPPEGGGNVTVRYPFILSPDGEP